MGLFDIFNTDDQQQAAADQISGIRSGLTGLEGSINQGIGAVNSDINTGIGNNNAQISSGVGALGNATTGADAALGSTCSAGLQPFLSNYGTASNGYKGSSTALNNALGLNGASGNAAAIQAFMNNPGIQSQLTMGDNAINAAEAASGKNASGNQMIDLANYNQGVANQSWQQYMGNLSGAQSNYGNQAATAAGGIGTMYSGLGNNLSGNLTNYGDRTLGAYTNAGNTDLGAYTNMGTSDLGAYTNIGNGIYGAMTSIGNANANADLAGLGASANGMGMITGLGSSLLGFLSDERAKDDIEPVGKLFDGQTVYKYRYKGDPRHQIGLLAQEVEDHEPDAILDFGPLMGVNYDKATSFAADLGRFM